MRAAAWAGLLAPLAFRRKQAAQSHRAVASSLRAGWSVPRGPVEAMAPRPKAVGVVVATSSMVREEEEAPAVAVVAKDLAAAPVARAWASSAINRRFFSRARPSSRLLVEPVGPEAKGKTDRRGRRVRVGSERVHVRCSRRPWLGRQWRWGAGAPPSASRLGTTPPSVAMARPALQDAASIAGITAGTPGAAGGGGQGGQGDSAQSPLGSPGAVGNTNAVQQFH